MIKDPKKFARTMTVVCLLTGLAATAVGIVALALTEYIIAAAMFLVAGWQVVNFMQWKRQR